MKEKYIAICAKCKQERFVVQKRSMKNLCTSCAQKTHGMTKTGTFKTYKSMKDRCYLKAKDNFLSYGGRGIVVCDRWYNSFLNFLEDMGERPEGMTLDRIDVNNNYCKENCRWATSKEQGRNKRTNRFVSALGRTQTISAWAEETGIRKCVIRQRLERGYSNERALTQKTDSTLKYLEFNGEILNVTGWAKKIGLKTTTLDERLRRGWSVEKALTTPKKEMPCKKK